MSTFSSIKDFSYENAVRELEFSLSGPQTVGDLFDDTYRNSELLPGKLKKYSDIQKGKDIALKKIEEDVKKHFASYVKNVVFVAKQVKEKTKNSNKISIIDFRTKLTPLAGNIELLLIIECEKFEDYISFGKKLSNIERDILTKNNIFSEILYYRKEENLDIDSVKKEYPFSLKV